MTSQQLSTKDKLSNFYKYGIQYKEKDYDSIMHFLIANTSLEKVPEKTNKELMNFLDEKKVHAFVRDNYDLVGDMVYEKVQAFDLNPDQVEFSDFEDNKLNKLFRRIINEVLDDYEDDPSTKIKLNNHTLHKKKSTKKVWPVDPSILTFTDGDFEEYGVSVLSNFFPYLFTLNGMTFVSPWQYVRHQLAKASGNEHNPKITNSQKEKVELFQNEQATKADSRGWVTSVRKYVKQLEKSKPEGWDEEKHLKDAMRAKFTQNYFDRYSPVKFISILRDTGEQTLAQYLKNEKIAKSEYIENYTTGVDEEKTKAGESFWEGNNVTGLLLEELRAEFANDVQLFTETSDFQAVPEDDEEDEEDDDENKVTEAKRKILDFLSTFYLYLLGKDREELEGLTGAYPQESLPQFAQKHDLLTRDFSGGYDYLLYLFRNAPDQHQEFILTRQVPRVLKKYLQEEEPTEPEPVDLSGMDMMFVSVPNFDTTVKRKRGPKETLDEVSEEEQMAVSRLQAGERGQKTFKIPHALPDTQKRDFSIDDRVDLTQEFLSPILRFTNAYEMFNRTSEDPTDPPVYSDILKGVYQTTLGVEY